VIYLLIGAFLTWIFQRKPKLIYYLGHESAFKLKKPQGIMVFTHSIVIVNRGRKPAKEARIGHLYLPPDFNIHPPAEYIVRELPAEGIESISPELRPKDIIIPIIRPHEVITISYLYYPPITYDKINT
ncbi:MAG: hypothetical protein ACETWM_19630, partial [Candidatus Lokiarchaeia archaeon]